MRKAAVTMLRSTPRVLITGFGPFPSAPDNASARLAPLLAAAAARALPGYRFTAAVLPTEWARAPAELARLYGEIEPLAAVHFGVSSRARGFEIEMRGLNRTCLSPDACGALPADDCVLADGPPLLASRLPVGRILTRLRARGVPVQVSRDAGSYLCNALLYHALHLARRDRPALKAGFVHMPAALAPRRVSAGRPPRPALLDWPTAVRGGLEILGATLGRPPSTVPGALPFRSASPGSGLVATNRTGV